MIIGVKIGSTDIEVALDSVAASQAHDRPLDDRAASLEAHPADEAVRPRQTWLQRNRAWIFKVASKAAAISSLILTAVLAWPAISSAGDARMATLLAEWTSLKEYLEFCEAHEWNPEGCAAVKNAPLPPPPMKPTLFRRISEYRLPLLGDGHQQPREASLTAVPIHTNPRYVSESWSAYTAGDILHRVPIVILYLFVCFLCLFVFLESLRRVAMTVRGFLRTRNEVAKEGLLAFPVLSAKEPPRTLQRLLQFLDRWTRPPALLPAMADPDLTVHEDGMDSARVRFRRVRGGRRS